MTGEGLTPPEGTSGEIGGSAVPREPEALPSAPPPAPPAGPPEPVPPDIPAAGIAAEPEPPVAQAVTIRGSCPFCDLGFKLEEASATLTCVQCRNTFSVYAVPPSVMDRPIIPQPVVPPTDPTVAPAPICARHANNRAVTACGRCGDFVCDVCATPVEGRVLCVRCFEFLHGRGELRAVQKRFSTPKVSLGLGIVATLLGWTVCAGIVAGPTAIITGILALRTLSRQPGLPGKNLAIAGIILGAVGVFEIVAMYLWGSLFQ